MNEFIAGAFSGLTQTIIGHPFDTLKVRIQNKKYDLKLAPYKYFRGITYPIISNTIVNSILFYSYDDLNKKLNNPFYSGALSGLLVTPIIYIFENGKTSRQMNVPISYKRILKLNGFATTTTREISAFSIYFGSYEFFKKYMHPLFAGGLSGLANWTCTYPIDVIRNRQIIHQCSIRNAIKMGDLWRGFTLCAIRAVLVNSAGFYVYELVSYKLL